MDIIKLTPEFAEAYVRFFDTTPHDYNVDEHKCYCVCWCSDDCEGKDFSTREKRREAALRYVREGAIQGYLAADGGTIVGWCNANTKADCQTCAAWRRLMGDIPTDGPGERVKSVFCFTVAPERKRKGIATKLLERVCTDAASDGFTCVEGYPEKAPQDENINFSGAAALYKKCGFTVHCEAGNRLIMRKELQP
ncbi:MAG: GNAT family N-acetyltransferase [Oscillospiraceae bacterium]|jgi:GNAT superfamily N-acetyltransferase|nr:GNAT family N-acetyltransferase [Oscillospiraceae bacterium]